MKHHFLIAITILFTNFAFGQEKLVNLKGLWASTSGVFVERNILQETATQKVFIFIDDGGYLALYQQDTISKQNKIEYLVYTFEQESSTITVNNGENSESFWLDLTNDSTIELLSTDSIAHLIIKFERNHNNKLPKELVMKTISEIGGVNMLNGLWKLNGTMSNTSNGQVFSLKSQNYYWSFNTSHPENNAGSLISFQQPLTIDANFNSINDVFNFYYLGEPNANESSTLLLQNSSYDKQRISIMLGKYNMGIGLFNPITKKVDVQYFTKVSPFYFFDHSKVIEKINFDNGRKKAASILDLFFGGDNSPNNSNSSSYRACSCCGGTGVSKNYDGNSVRSSGNCNCCSGTGKVEDR